MLTFCPVKKLQKGEEKDRMKTWNFSRRGAASQTRIKPLRRLFPCAKALRCGALRALVNHDDFVPSLQQPVGEVRTDKTSAAGDEHAEAPAHGN